MQQVRIFKADLRGRTESKIFRRFSTLNFDDYEHASRAPFGLLLALNDETLGAGNTIFRHIEQHKDIVILPLVGGLVFRDSFGNENTIGTEQVCVFSGEKGNAYQLSNPYEKALVNYLQIWFRADANQFRPGASQRDFVLERNSLVPFFGSPSLPMHSQTLGFIGLYDGRQSSVYHLQHPNNGLFIFVVSGAFECEDRLIESRDALALTGCESVGYEALSDDAMLFIIETPMPE